MTNDSDDILHWLQSRPLQDNPNRVEASAAEELASFDQWVKTGRKIPDIESRLIQISERNEDPVIRSAATMALGFTGGDQSVEPLVRALQKDVPIVAMEAAASLGRLGKPQAVEPLCEALKNSDGNVRANACTALGVLGGERALSCLKAAESDNNSFVRSAAASALGKNR
jgi:HEAT repeat protein